MRLNTNSVAVARLNATKRPKLSSCKKWWQRTQGDMMKLLVHAGMMLVEKLHLIDKPYVDSPSFVGIHQTAASLSRSRVVIHSKYPTSFSTTVTVCLQRSAALA